MTRSLDLGCGPAPRNRFGCDEAHGVDLYASPGVLAADLAVEPIPYPDDHFDVVECRDFLEHIPRLVYVNGDRRNAFLELLDEVWRVLVPGGRFYAETPAWPHGEAFQDPTHVNVITEATLAYVTDPAHLRLTRTYGFRGTFAGRQHWSTEFAPWLVWDLVAVKR